MDNFGYLFAVYSIVWLVIFGFVLSLINKQNKLRKEIDSLKAMLAEKGLKEE
jgi:CcmD family protein